jgi:hypothetical protein
MVVCLEGPLEVVDSLTCTGFRATHQAEVRMLIQAPWKEPEMMSKGHWLQNHTQGGTLSSGH